MNDRVSKEPPSLYTREEQIMEQYAKNAGQNNVEMDTTWDAGIEVDKPSGVFRFGKAIANAFRPLTGWQSMWKEKDKERPTSPEKSILQERQAKAAEAYAELKKDRYKGTHTVPTARQNLDTPANGDTKGGYERTQTVPTARQSLDIPTSKNVDAGSHQVSFRDSGIDMDEQRSSSDQTVIHMMGFTEALLAQPAPRPGTLSPTSITSSRRKSSLQLRRPSFQSLKKVKSHLHLSPVKRSSETPSVPALSPDLLTPSSTFVPPSNTGLRREPSKKDMAKQHRLSKRVSDLETKLESARRELESSIANAPPVPDLAARVQRVPFKPGNLPSLPSERNMSPQKEDLPPPVPRIEIAPFTTASSTDQKPTFPQRRSSRLALVDTGYKTDIQVEATGVPEARKTTSIASDSRKVSDTKPLQSSTANVTKSLPRLPTKTPSNTPTKLEESIPPFPIVLTDIDANKENELNRGESPVLGRPATSPVRTRSKSGKRGISPPPPSLSSMRKRRVAMDVRELTEEGKEISDKIGKLVEVGKPEKRREAKRQKGVMEDLGSEAIPRQSDEFDWDEDVF